MVKKPTEPNDNEEVLETPAEELEAAEATEDVSVEAQTDETVEMPEEVQETPDITLDEIKADTNVTVEDILDKAAEENILSDESDAPVTVQPVQFASFDEHSNSQGEVNKNLDILMDVKLQLTVELGRTELPIKKVLELTRGSIIELEKVAGEPVELYANGKLVAHGEVVVIEDNFGLRITSITEPEDRLKGV